MNGLDSILNKALEKSGNAAAARLTNSTSATGSAGAVAASSQSFLNPSNFFELLTAQLSHQDPLSPAGSTQFMSELAQLSTASGIQSLSQMVSGFGQNQQTNLRLRAAALVGHAVGIPGNTLTLHSGGKGLGAYSIPASASQVVVTVADSSGTVVGQMKLGQQSPGVHEFQWPGNGQPAGNYTFSVQALSASGSLLPTQPISLSKISSVQVSSAGTVSLELDGHAGAVPLDQVTSIF